MVLQIYSFSGPMFNRIRNLQQLGNRTEAAPMYDTGPQLPERFEMCGSGIALVARKAIPGIHCIHRYHLSITRNFRQYRGRRDAVQAIVPANYRLAGIGPVGAAIAINIDKSRLQA